MKNILLPLALAISLTSCQKTETQNNDTVTESATEHQHETGNEPNEMVALMDDMMTKMHDQAPTRNNSADFAAMMIAHHDGAVEMSELLLKKGTDAELKKFAEKVIKTQKKEIEQMRSFRNTREISTDFEEFQKELSQSMDAMMNKNIKVYNNIDHDYAAQMIPHHQSAIDMAKVYLKYGQQPDLIQLCNDIIAEQTSEIAELQAWLDKN